MLNIRLTLLFDFLFEDVKENYPLSFLLYKYNFSFT